MKYLFHNASHIDLEPQSLKIIYSMAFFETTILFVMVYGRANESPPKINYVDLVIGFVLESKITGLG